MFLRNTNSVTSAREQALDSQTLSLISKTAVDQLGRFHTDFRVTIFAFSLWELYLFLISKG